MIVPRDPMDILRLFYKNAWPVIGMEVCSAVSEFFQSSKMLKQVNTTLLVSYPQVQLPSSVSDFRPIACCNVIYKAIAKILVRRMQQVLHLLIDSSQNAFVPGRSIAECTHQSVSIIKDSLSTFAAMAGLHVNPNKSQVILSKSVRSGRQHLINLMGFREVFLLPKSVINAIENRMRTFLWQGSSGRGIAKVGTGLRFYVWLDMWHPRGPLSQTFPRGPSITGLPTDSLLHNVIEQGRWNWPSVTDFDIQEIVAGLPLIHPNPDSIRWKSRDGKFSTAAALKMLQPPSGNVPWRWLIGGKFKIPRHDFILWLALLERLSTLDRMWMLLSDFNGWALIGDGILLGLVSDGV
ncbi:UNVERIFIED_CONTAM: hypothetical protein Sradi_7269200, partial [Sesamum radiatum]